MAGAPFLDVNGIEVIYNHVILVLKGVSLQVPEGKIVALMGGNGAGKTTTLRAVSNLLAGERGAVTKGSIELRGERIEHLSTSDMVARGVIQVMEGRRCFGHLSIEENLLTGAYTRRDGKARVAATLDKVYRYFPRLKERRSSQAAYTSGGEQQMCAIGRAPAPSTARRAAPSSGWPSARGRWRTSAVRHPTCMRPGSCAASSAAESTHRPSPASRRSPPCRRAACRRRSTGCPGSSGGRSSAGLPSPGSRHARPSATC